MKCAQKIPVQCDCPWCHPSPCWFWVKSGKWSELPAGVAGTGALLSSTHSLFALPLLSSSLYPSSKQLRVRLFWAEPIPIPPPAASGVVATANWWLLPSLWHPELWGWAGTQWFKNFSSGKRIREMKAIRTEAEKCWARELQVEACVLGVEGGKDDQKWFTSRVE